WNVTITCAPASTNAKLTARPNPPVPPTTKTTFAAPLSPTVLSDHVQPSHLVTTAPPAQPLLLSIRRATLIAKTAIRVARADSRLGQKSFVGFLVSNKALRRFWPHNGRRDSRRAVGHIQRVRRG